jgi:hypothetical protein
VLHIVLTLRKEKARIEYLNFLAVLYILTGLSQALNNLSRVLYDISIVVSFDHDDAYRVFRSLIQDLEIEMLPLYFSMICAMALYLGSFGDKNMFKFIFRKKRKQ